MNEARSTKSLRQLHTRLPALFAALLFLASGCSFAVTTKAQTPAPARTEERELGIELYHQGKFKEAAKQLRKAANKNKADAEAWHYLGLSLLRQEKEIKNASKAFETAVKLRPDFAETRSGLSYTYLLRNKLSEAVREARAALDLDPKIAQANYIIGVVRLRTGSFDEALKAAQETIRLDPQLARSYLLKSQALIGIYSKKAFENTRAARKPSSELTPEERAERRKKLIQTNGPLVEAAESLEIYLKLNPSDPSGNTWRDQLQTLKVFAAYSGDKAISDETIFAGIDVTTKARVLTKPEPAYTEKARQAGITGVVVLRALFAADGTVKHILVLTGLPDGLTEAAIRAAKKIKFIPATIDGRPVSMFIQLEYNFNLY